MRSCKRPFRILAGALSALAFTLAACTHPSSAGHEADVKAIQASEVQWNQDLAAHDLDKIVAHYADDATMILAGSAPLAGKDAIRKAYMPVAQPTSSLKLENSRVEIAAAGDLAISQGSYALDINGPMSGMPGGSGYHDHGSYLLTYRKQGDGTWKIVIDISSSALLPTQETKKS